jgi:Rad and Gem related GTP binding protein 1
MSSYDPHGFLVIYSSSDKSSFLVAERVLQALWTSENIAQKAVILVGNKADLARSRLVSSEGKLKSNLNFCGAIKCHLTTL